MSGQAATVFHDRPFREWERLFTETTPDEQRGAEAEAAYLAQRYARLSAYLSVRNAGGTHGAGVKAQNHCVRHVRKALGFTQHTDPLYF